MIELDPIRTLTPTEAERLLAAWLGDPVVCSGIVALTGGMVNTVCRLEFDRPPHRAVVKLHRPGASARFAAEARALTYLAAETSCPVPAVYGYDERGELVPHAYLRGGGARHLPRGQ